MNITQSSGLSELYINGELVDKKGFITESDGDTINYLFNNSDEVITGKIEESKLNEEDLMNLLDISKSQKSLIDKLTQDYPLTSKSKTHKKSNKKQKKRKTKKNVKVKKK